VVVELGRIGGSGGLVAVDRDGTVALPSLLTIWEKTRGTANEVKAVGTVSNGAMTLYSINPNVKTIADFTDKDRIAVPTVRLSFNAMMLQMAAEQLWNDPHRLDHLTVALGALRLEDWPLIPVEVQPPQRV